MTQEEKELLLKDISGRLSYGLIVQISLFRNDGRKRDIDLDPHVTENIWELIDKYHALPYLRPMDSMTEEDNLSLSKYVGCSIRTNYGEIYFPNIEDNTLGNWEKIFDWLNTHHFDYRGLIEKGLAIEITEDNNPYKGL